jgi:hypothetical protein
MSSPDIIAYNAAQTPEIKGMCQHLMDAISAGLPDASAKLYHANPVWFINDNPIVGYDVAATHVNLLFWSGQSFDEPGLVAKGKFKAAGTSYNSSAEIDATILTKWLEKAKNIQWDYKNLRQNNGELHRI